MGQFIRNLRDQYQREFVKLFEKASQRNNRASVFSDFIQMSAISISNAVDATHAEEREKAYLRMAKQYDKEELTCFAKMFVDIVKGLEAYPDQDFMGELFMNLELGNQYRGQFFTPYNVSRMMAEMLVSKEGLKQELSEKGWIGTNDCACGAGGMLVAFANACLECGVNYQQSVLFVGQDVDYTAGCMCYVQLSLLGCPGYVVIANTLSDPLISLDERNLLPVPTQNIWYTPFYFLPIWDGRQRMAYLDCLIQIADRKSDENRVKAEAPQQSTVEAQKPEAEPAVVFNETRTGQLTFF